MFEMCVEFVIGGEVSVGDFGVMFEVEYVEFGIDVLVCGGFEIEFWFVVDGVYENVVFFRGIDWC